MKHLLLSSALVLLGTAVGNTLSGAESTGSDTTIQLTESMARNVGLETAEVTLQPIQKTFPALGGVEPDPVSVAAVTSRIAGRVTRLAVREGQRVKAGDLLVEIESRIAADPPPRLSFTAPIDGVVLELRVVPGAAVEPEQALVTIGNLDTVFAVMRVFEGQLPNVRVGQKVRVRPVAYRDRELPGTVERTAGQLERETGTLRTFVRVNNEDNLLLPGMRVQADFVVEEGEDAVVVPRGAVLGDSGRLFVFRPTDAAGLTFQRVEVATGLRDDRFIEIIDGVLPGDRVVVRGNYQLQYVGGGAAKLEDDHAHAPGSGAHKH